VTPRVAAPLLVLLLSVTGYAVTKRAIDDDRRTSAERLADNDAQEVRGLLDRTRSLTVGLGNALQGEPKPNSHRFAALAGSAASSLGLTSAMWVEQVSPNQRPSYERRIGRPVSAVSDGRPVTGHAPDFLPATFVTGLPYKPGTDVAGLPALGKTLRNPASIFAGTATPIQSVAGRRGFFVVQGVRFGRGPGSRGFLAMFVPADWLRLSLDQHAGKPTISLDGRRLVVAARGEPAGRARFQALTRNWRVDLAREPRTALQGLLPGLAAVWPPAIALLVLLVGRGVLRRRRAEREVEDIFDLSLDLLCVVGTDGYLKRANPAFEQTLGYTEAELLTRPFLEFVHADDREATSEAVTRLQTGQRAARFESRYIRGDGAVRWLEWSMRPMLERDRLYGAARDVTDNRTLVDEQAALRHVATMVAQGEEAGELFNAVAAEVGQLLGAEATRLLRYEPDGSASVVGAHGASDSELGVETGRDLLDLSTAVATPIVVSRRQWGVIVAAWKDAEIRPDTATRMAQFTELVATAVANAESRGELAASRMRIVATADDTRRRLERDLHDGAQQRLVHTIITLKLAQRELANNGDAQATELVGEALENAERGIEELRVLARGIHPRILSSGGLGPALKVLAGRSQIPVAVEVVPEGRLPERVEVAAYYVVSEALANAAKHSNASAVQVNVDSTGSELLLSVSDNGIGGADPGRGSGLVGLKDRVEAAGGTLTVDSPPGEGTLLTVAIPLRAD
jgi:PAS domain S-box-containing protein